MLELIEDLASKLKITAIGVIKQKEDKKIKEITINIYSEERLDSILVNQILANYSEKPFVFKSGTPYQWNNYLLDNNIPNDLEVVYDPKGYLYRLKKAGR